MSSPKALQLFPRSLISAARAAAIAVPALLAAGTAMADKRVALVIGNAAYQNAAPLSNPKNDAVDVSAALRNVGFEVVDGTNLDKRNMDQVLTRFSRAAQDADAALVFYAGHGLQFQGQNYLIPVDTKLDDEFGLQFETTRLDDIITALDRAKGVKILVLDACRNNPFAERLARAPSATRAATITQGLAKIERTRGMVIAYATQANDVATDGSGRNSPFSAAFVKELGEPGVEVGTLFRRVALAVNTATGGKQTPELSVSLVGEFYFAKAESDTEVWQRVRTSNDAATLNDFIARFPKSFLVDDARSRLQVIAREARDQAERREKLEKERARIERELAALQRGTKDTVDKNTTPEQSTAVAAKADTPAQGDGKVSVIQPLNSVTRQNTAVDQLKQAAVQPGGGSVVVSGEKTGPSEKEVLVSIQQELTRVGCFSGATNETWTGPRTVRAVREFTRLSSLSAPKGPTGEFLDAIKEKPGRVCPLTCGARQVEQGGACVAKVCPAGSSLDKRGRCVEVVIRRQAKVAPPRLQRRRPAFEEERVEQQPARFQGGAARSPSRQNRDGLDR